MRAFKSSLLAFAASLMIPLSLGCKNPLEPCEPKVSIENQSTSNRTYSVIVDGVNMGVVEVGQKREWEVAKGRHRILLVYTNTGQVACSESDPIVECETFGIICRN